MRNYPFLSAAALIITAGVSTARAETTLATDMHLSADHSSNKRLLLERDESVSGYMAEANLDFKRDTPRWAQTLGTQWLSSHYSGDYGLGSDDQNLDGTIAYKSETAKTELRANAINDTTLTDQLDFSGYTEERKRRRYVSGGMSHQWKLSTQDQWILDYEESTAKYVDAEDTSLNDYRFETGTSTFQHNFSSVLASYIALARSHYVAPDAGNTSDSDDVSIGTLWQPSAPTMTKLGIGQRRTDYSYYDGLFNVDDQFNYVTLEWSHDLPGGNVTFKTQDLSQPTGDGSVYRTRKGSVDYYTNVGMRQIVSVSAAYGEQRASAAEFIGSDRNNTQVTVSYRYRFGRETGVQTVLTYRDQTYVSVDERAASTDVWFGIYWAPLPYRW